MISEVEQAGTPSAPPSGRHIRRLRERLDAAGFTASGVREALQARGDVLTDGSGAAVHDRRLERVEPPLATLIRLLILDREVETREAEDDLSGDLLGDLVEHGIVGETDGSVRGRIRIVPHDHLLVASDLLHATIRDHVAAVHRPSATLANLTVRRPVATALDVGTGNGVQALLCAAHCAQVVATDVNERALAFAEFNAALNGVDNVELRAGSFFEPAGDQLFDLVVCNPPYVISPESSMVFRDSGLPGDAVSAQLVAELPSHVAEGGFGTIMISWAADEDPAARPTGWLDGRGCDAWLLHTGSDDPLGAAVAWNKAAGSDPDALRERIDAWLEYYTRLGIDRIAYGALVVHRRSGGSNWVRAAELPPQRLQQASAHLERLFAAQESLTGLLDRPITLVDAALVDRTTRLAEGKWTLVGATVRLEEGIGFGANLDRAGAALVELLDGAEPLRTQLPALAESLGVPEPELTEYAESLARHLVEHGMAV